MTTDRNGIEPIRRSTLGATVTQGLRELVIAGAFEPGAILSEVDLAERFGVSRGPVREAVLHLLQEGLLRREPRRGVSVPIVDEFELADLQLARQAIETAALRVVVDRDLPDLDTQLQAVLDTMRAAADRGEWARVADMDIAFHTLIVEASASPRLARMWATVGDETRAHLSRTARYHGSAGIVDEHAEIARLLARQDRHGLLEAIDAHVAPRRREPAAARRSSGSSSRAARPVA